MNEPGITALGEFGLDRRTDTPEEYIKQEIGGKQMMTNKTGMY